MNSSKLYHDFKKQKTLTEKRFLGYNYAKNFNTFPMESSDVKIPDDLAEENSQGIRKEGTIRRIVVDRAACIGAQSCVVVAPGVFQMDDENLAYVVDPDSHDEDTVMLSAQACPVLAIHLYDADGNKIFPKDE